MSEHPKISLIVTFYNASATVDRCIKSVISQTHKSFEVLLVDDGSADDTYHHMMQFVNVENVRCFKKENGGAGSARNFGVAQAKGDYISFVDGDDFVSPYYLEMMDLAMLDHKCNSAIGSFVESNASSSDRIAWCDDYSTRRVPREEAIRMLAYEKLTESPCAKLLPKQLYLEHPFPERYYEDVAIAGHHFLSAGDVAHVRTPIYCYMMSVGSITHRQKASIKQLDDFVWAIDEFLAPIEKRCPGLASGLAFRRALECSRAHSLAVRVADDRWRAANIDTALRKQIAKARKEMVGDPLVPKSQALRFAMLEKWPAGYDVLFQVYERVIKTGGVGK